MEWIFAAYNDLVENQGDPRSNKLLFIKSPCFTITMVLSYLFFSIYAGPKFMKNRKPFDLKKIVILYNFLHVCISAYLVYWASTTAWFKRFDNWFCVPLDPNDVEPSTLNIISNSWWFYASRFIEFIDTIFFVLRKKTNQISVLHLVHHSTVPLFTWLGMKFAPMGHFTFAGYINAYVHIVMYTYYMLSAMGPSVRKYLWWKKYLTVLQLVQFMIVVSHTFIAQNIECPGPKWFLNIVMGQAILFFALFLQFYVGKYTKTQSNVQSNTNFIQNLYNKILNIYNRIIQCKTFFEACIPNQAELFDDPISDSDPKDPSVLAESYPKQKLK